MSRNKYIAILLLLFIVQPVLSQEIEEVENTGSGLVFGLNFGVYLPGKYTANFYNGSENHENKISYIMKNSIWYAEIKELLGANKAVEVAAVPTNMRYKMVFYPGLVFQYNLSRTFAIVIESNYMKLQANDAVLLYVDRVDHPTNPENYEKLIPIRGVEERVYINAGVKKIIPYQKNIDFFMTAGLNMNSTKVKKNFIVVNDKEYNIVNIYGGGTYNPGMSQEFVVYQGGIGWGVWGSLGTSLHFGAVGLETGFDFTAVKIKFPGFDKKITPGGGFFIRFLLSPF